MASLISCWAPKAWEEAAFPCQSLWGWGGKRDPYWHCSLETKGSAFKTNTFLYCLTTPTAFRTCTIQASLVWQRWFFKNWLHKLVLFCSCYGVSSMNATMKQKKTCLQPNSPLTTWQTHSSQLSSSGSRIEKKCFNSTDPWSIYMYCWQD